MSARAPRTPGTTTASDARARASGPGDPPREDPPLSVLAPEDVIHPGRPMTVGRYSGGARINHWITAVSLILLAISGLALFHPSLFFATGLFGGGQNTRAVHPWIGVVLFVSFAGLFVRFWRANLWNRGDAEWVSHYKDVLAGNEERVPEVPRYNAGQKFIFWTMSLLILALIVTGVIIWENYFDWMSSLQTKRYSVLIHSMLGVVFISILIVHVYAAFWVRGTLRAMTRGSVTGGWAWRHHRKWLKEIVDHRRIAGRDRNAPAE